MGRFHAIKSEVRTININPSVAWKATPVALHRRRRELPVVRRRADELGQLQRRRVRRGRRGRRSAALAAAGCGAAPPAVARGWPRSRATPGAGAGTSARWSSCRRRRRASGSRTGPAMKHYVKGDVSFGNRPALLAAGVAGRSRRRRRSSCRTPPRWRSRSRSSPALQLLADFTWTGWSSIKDLSIYRESGTPLTSTPLEFDDSWRVGLGANYQANEMVKVRARRRLRHDAGEGRVPHASPPRRGSHVAGGRLSVGALEAGRDRRRGRVPPHQ